MFKKLIYLFKFIKFHFLNANNCFVPFWKVNIIKITIRIIKASQLLPFVNGAKIIISHGMIGVTDGWYSRMYEYNSLKHQLKLLQVKHKFLSNTLYLEKFNKIKCRISGKNIFTIGTG